MESSGPTIDDGLGDDLDRIEMRNVGDQTVDLPGYHWTDNDSNLERDIHGCNNSNPRFMQMFERRGRWWIR